MSSGNPKPRFQLFTSPGFAPWLESLGASLAFSTYQVGKLFLVGVKENQRLSVFERTFNRCMGLWSDTQTLWLGSAFQLWRLQNMLPAGIETEEGYDRLYVPQAALTTGDVDIHDIAVDEQQRPLFVNTLFSCLARSSECFSFEPFWRPSFVSRLAAEDRCHLNGMACVNGQPRYVTVCAETDSRKAWRQQRAGGGCVIDVQQNEVLTRGLSMPHSPRWFQNRLWLLDSGRGYFGRLDTNNGHFEPLVFCPGYARGLSFLNGYAIVGVSKPREKTFAGLPLDDELARRRAEPRCGLQVIDLQRGEVVHWLALEGAVEELYDVLFLPGVRRPKAFGLKTDEIRRNIWYQHQGRPVRWTASRKSSE